MDFSVCIVNVCGSLKAVDNLLSEDYTVVRSHIMCNKVIYSGFIS